MKKKYKTKEEAFLALKIQQKKYKQSPKGREIQKKYREKPEIKAQNKINNRTGSIKRVEEFLKGNFYPYFKNKVAQLKSFSKANKIKFNLTGKHLVDTLNNQNGCCYYTKILLRPYRAKTDPTTRRPGKSKNLAERLTQVSVDRIIPKDGYIIGNVVLVSDLVNTMKSNFNDDQFKSIISLISKNHNIGHNYRGKEFKELYNEVLENVYNDLMPVVLEQKKFLNNKKKELLTKKT